MRRGAGPLHRFADPLPRFAGEERYSRDLHLPRSRGRWREAPVGAQP